MFLGLVGVPPTPISYPTFTQLATGAGFGASTLRAAATVAAEAIVAQGALLVGAGLGGFFIGQKILENLEYTGVQPTIRQLFKTPSNIGQIRVIAEAKLVNGPLQTFDNVFNSPIVIPVSNVLDNDIIQQGALVGTGAVFVGYLQAARSLIEVPLTVVSINKVNGDPIEGLRPNPSYDPVAPKAPTKRPILVPIAPGIPDFPITPEIVPYDPTLPRPQDENREPGVVVKIPEVGLQITFSPTGVTVGKYSAPDTEPFEFPDSTNEPPPKKVATPPCPCPEGESKDDEIICRIRTLQDEILDDGYTFTSTTTPSGQGASVTISEDELFTVGITITEFPRNERTQPSAPGTSTVFFIGWFAWMYNGFPGERVPISYLNTNWIAPPDANGYTYSLHSLCLSTSTYVTRRKKDYIDLC